MGQYTSYYLYQKFVKYGSQDWLPAYPNEYSISGDGTNPLVIKSENDVECGYIPPSQPIYRWVNLPIETDYICDETPAKFQATYQGGQTYSAACDGYADLITADTKPSGYDYSAMTSAEIGNCITSIGNYAFRGCSGLTSCTIGSGVTSIDYGAFQNCSSLTSIVIPNSVTSIGQYAFDGCRSLTSITIPDSVTTIRHGAFSYCSGLTSVAIPNSVTSIGDSLFWNCYSLTSVTIGSGITSIGSGVFWGCSGLTSIDIPSGVTSIGQYAFQYCRNLSNITIPNSVTNIGSQAFYYCTSLSSVTISNSITSINSSTFGQCSSLTSVTIPSGVTTIGGSAFSNCSGLTSIIINATTPPTLGDNYVFYETNNCPIYVPCDSVSAYKAASEWSAYASRIQGIPPCGNNKLDITIESGTTYSLSCDATSSITQNEVNNLEIIPPYGDYSMDIQISDCVSTIGNSAFYIFGGHGSGDAGSMKICIPDTVTSIGNYAFYCGNKSASRAYIEATIGSGITSIGSYAFLAKSSTDENMRGRGTLLVTINATTPPTIGSNPFSVTGTTGYVYLRISVPAASVNTYKSAWPQYASNITAIS